MGFIFSEVFWGVLLIILGVSFIIKVIFKVNIPVFRIFLACFFIFLGIGFLTGNGFNFERAGHSIIFNESKIAVTSSADDYNVIFGSGTFDLSEFTLNKGVTKIKINTVFGQGIIKLNHRIPTKIQVDAAFADARMPDDNKSNAPFGSYVYTTGNFNEDEDYLLIKTSVVFGELKILENE